MGSSGSGNVNRGQIKQGPKPKLKAGLYFNDNEKALKSFT